VRVFGDPKADSLDRHADLQSRQVAGIPDLILFQFQKVGRGTLEIGSCIPSFP